METIPVGRVKTKRRNPFGDEYYREQKTIKNDMEIIYERTLNMLMNSKGNGEISDCFPQAELLDWCDNNSDAFVNAKCSLCTKANIPTIPCSFCETIVCNLCVRQCEKCQDVFCSFCSTYNYETRQDRVFCLSCNRDESVRHRNNDVNNF